MGFSSMDNFISDVTVDGQFRRTDWNKNFLPTTAAVAGEWFNMFRGAGNPAADTIGNTGTNLTFQQLTDTTSGATGIRHGGNVYPDTKHITNASAFSAAATTMPAIIMMCDFLGFYRVTTTTTITSQALTNTMASFSTFTADAGTDIITLTNNNLFAYTRVRLTTTGTLPAGLATATDYYAIAVTQDTFKLATSYANAVAGTAIDITDAGTGTHTLNTILPRYTSGAGVQAFLYANNATPLGAGTPSLSFPDYTNSAQTTGKATPTVLPIGKTAAANGLILYSGTGAGKYGPFMPLAAGDSGIAQVNNVQLSVTYTSGEFSIMLAKPLFTLPMTTLGVASEREFMNQLPSLPRVYDGACLVPLIYNGAATPTNSSFFGHMDFAWG